MQFYIYDFSKYIDKDVEETGRFDDYPLDKYWTEDNHFAYLIKVADQYAGFVLIKSVDSETEKYFTIAEFFIMKKYRRCGIGKAAADDIFRLHPGYWQVFQMAENKRAQKFWREVIGSYTNGQFTKTITGNQRVLQKFRISASP